MLDLFTVVGDPHITPKSFDKGIRLFQIVEELGRPTIWLGDFLDTKEVIRGKCLNLLYEYFGTSKLQHIILIGNHDWFNLECLDHSLKALDSLKNITIIDTVRVHPTLPFVFFPYIHDKIKLKELLKESSSKDLIAFGHFEVSGFDFGNGHLCEDGIVTHDDFKGFKKVISGHFHKLQQTGNFTYLGTPFSHSFGEANQDKVIGTYQLSTNTLTLIPTEFPRHVSVKIDFSKSESEKKLQEFLNGNETNLIRVQLFGSPEDVAKLDKSKYQKYGIKWEDKSESSDGPKINLDETLNNKTQFQQWSTDIRKLDNETMTLGLSILEAVGAK